MKKILAVVLLLMMSMTTVSANLCDRAVDEDMWNTHPEFFDLNEDGVTNLSDLALFSSQQDDDSFCEGLFGDYFHRLDIPYVTGNKAFSENLDKYSEVRISSNMPFWGRESIAREIQYKATRYKIGFSWGGVQLYTKQGVAVDTPEGLNIEVEPRTFWTRTLVFTRE